MADLEADGDAAPSPASARFNSETSTEPETSTATNADKPAISARRCNDHSLRFLSARPSLGGEGGSREAGRWLPVRGGMLQLVGQALGAFGRLGRSPRGNRSRDPPKLAFDACLDAIRRAPDQWIQPADREVEPVDVRDRIAASAVGGERDHLTHVVTLVPGSDTVREERG